jgi:hypothetical protein
MCAHNLEIEKGRYFQINRTERFCKICNDLEIEDENHFLWQCEKYRKDTFSDFFIFDLVDFGHIFAVGSD